MPPPAVLLLMCAHPKLKGGAAYIANDCSVTITSSKFTGNSASSAVSSGARSFVEREVDNDSTHLYLGTGRRGVLQRLEHSSGVGIDVHEQLCPICECMPRFHFSVPRVVCQHHGVEIEVVAHSNVF